MEAEAFVNESTLQFTFFDLEEDFDDRRKPNHEALGRHGRVDFSARGEIESSASTSVDEAEGMASVISIASVPSESSDTSDRASTEKSSKFASDLSFEEGERDPSFRPGEEFEDRRNLNHDRECIVGGEEDIGGSTREDSC